MPKKISKFSLLKTGKAPKWQALLQMGEGRSKMLQESLGWCLGARGGVYDRHSSLKLSEIIQKGHFFLRKGASVDLVRTTAMINPFCCTVESQVSHHLGITIIVNLNGSLPKMTELSGGGTFSRVNHLPLWKHLSLSMLQLNHLTFALRSVLLVLLR